MSHRKSVKKLRRRGTRGLWTLDFGFWAAALFLLLPGSLPAFGQTPAQDFAAANKLYYENKFTDAAAAYEKLIQSGRATAAVYFNLGNAWFKSGQLGRAIAAYRRAETVAQRDPDVRANLQFARNQAQGTTSIPNRWQRWLQKLSLNEWTLLAGAGLWLCLGLFTAVQFRPAWKGALRGWLVFTALSAAVACACLALALQQAHSRPTAIITQEAVVQQGPVEGSPTAFAVHDGAELRVLDQKDEWLLVTTDPRRVGWVRRDRVLLAPPI